MTRVEKVLWILKRLGEAPYELGVTELAREMGHGKSGIYKILLTLVEEGFVVKNDNNKEYLYSQCLDLGPGSGNANLAAKTAEIDVSVYFAKYQVPVAIVVMMVIAVLHYLVQKWFDKKAGHVIKVTAQQAAATDEEENPPPTIYAILPVLPLVLILAFSELFISSIKMDVITAMLIELKFPLILDLKKWMKLRE